MAVGCCPLRQQGSPWAAGSCILSRGAVPAPCPHFTCCAPCRDSHVHKGEARGETPGCNHTETSWWGQLLPALSSTSPRATGKLQVSHVNGPRDGLGCNFQENKVLYPSAVPQGCPFARSSNLEQGRPGHWSLPQVETSVLPLLFVHLSSLGERKTVFVQLVSKH